MGYLAQCGLFPTAFVQPLQPRLHHATAGCAVVPCWRPSISIWLLIHHLLCHLLQLARGAAQLVVTMLHTLTCSIQLAFCGTNIGPG